MSHSDLLSRNDVLYAIRLAHQAAELGDDAVRWRKCLLDGLLRKMPGGSVGIAVVMDQPVTPHTVGMRLIVYGDAGPPNFPSSYNRYLACGDVSDNPVTPAFLRIGPRSFVRRREEVATDQQWYGSDYFNRWIKPMDQDGTLFSQVMIPALACTSGLGFMRPLRSSHHSLRDARLVHLAHCEIGRLWRRGYQATQVRLGARLTQTLQAIMRGLSEKQIAGELGLKRTTVHNYLQLLHRKLNVQTRSELLLAGLQLQKARGPRILL